MATTMIGGAKFQETFISWTKQSNHLFITLFGIILLMWATFSEKLPASYRWQLSTSAGRLLLLLLLYITYDLAGWIPALLFTIAVALTWANRPIYKPVEEGFGGMKVTKVQGNKWFVEDVLHESPHKIVEDRVTTTAVQDDSEGKAGRVSR